MQHPAGVTAHGAAAGAGAGAGASGAARLPKNRAKLPARRYLVPTLEDLCVATLVKHADSIGSLRGLSEECTAKILAGVWQELKLTYELAAVFRDTGHPLITKFLRSHIDDLDAIPSYGATTFQCTQSLTHWPARVARQPAGDRGVNIEPVPRR